MSTDKALADLVRAGSSAALLAIADALETGSLSLGSSSVGIAAVRGVSDHLAAQAFRSFRSLEPTITAQTVAITVRTATSIRDVERLESPSVEITWTGPDAEGPLVTENSAAMERCLKDCRDIGEILLVGYSLTVAKGSFMERVIDLLTDASRRQARIQVILHQDDEARNKNELMKHWDVFTSKPEVYTWDPPPEHPYTKLHAKCLVVDRLQMLVTSANFTFHGLESNIELGLLVRNQRLATAVHERFDHLINAGVLRRWEDVS